MTALERYSIRAFRLTFLECLYIITSLVVSLPGTYVHTVTLECAYKLIYTHVNNCSFLLIQC